MIIDVIGCNGSTVSAAGQTALAAADLIVGSRRLLAGCLLPEAATKVVLEGNILGMLPGLIGESKHKKMAVLASGDPLYCGIGGTLLRFVPAKRLRFWPSPTAFQTLFARLGEPWETAALFSLHGRKNMVPYRQILQSPLAAIYGDADRPAQAIAAGLIAAYPACAKRPAAVGCNLGLADEIVIYGSLQKIAANAEAGASLSVLALLPDTKTAVPPVPLGLPDSEYLHYKNMITHPELRAIVLAKLALTPGVMWDLGAGSGSVGIEAAGLCPQLWVHAVERNPGRFEQLSANIMQQGLNNITSYCQEIEAAVSSLPAPDRIFIGGGGAEHLEQCFELLNPNGILVMTGVTVDTVSQMGIKLSKYRSELLTVNISRAREIVNGEFMFCAENPITVGVYRKPLHREKK